MRRRLLLGGLLPITLLLAWEIVWQVPAWRRESLSRPFEVAQALVQTLIDGSLWMATRQTFEAALTGFAIAASIGVLGGIALGLMPRVQRIVGPSIDGLRPMPAVALMPLALMVFGFGVAMEASVIAFACVWPVLLLTTSAVRQVSPGLLEVAQALEMGPVRRVVKIVLPAAMPGIAVSLRLALSLSLIVAVTVEIVLNPRGLGYAIMSSQQALRFDAMYAQIFWICVTGWAVGTLSQRLLNQWPGMASTSSNRSAA